MLTRLWIRRPRTVSRPSSTVLSLEALDLRNAPSSLLDPVHDLSSHPSTAGGHSADTRAVSSTVSDLDALPKSDSSASGTITIDPSLSAASPSKKHPTGDAGGTVAAPSTHAKATPAATAAQGKTPATTPTPAIPVKAGSAVHDHLSSTPSVTKGDTASVTKGDTASVTKGDTASVTKDDTASVTKDDTATAMDTVNVTTGVTAPAPGAQPPKISNFIGVEGTGGTYWTFTGTVTDANPAGLTVNFGGLPDLEGLTATTNSSGNFVLTTALQTNGTDDGTATAVTTDRQGLQSNTACFYVMAS